MAKPFDVTVLLIDAILIKHSIEVGRLDASAAKTRHQEIPIP
jgi:hypothetical protein